MWWRWQEGGRDHRRAHTTVPPTTLATTTTKQSTTTVKPTTTTKAVPATWPLTGVPIQGDPNQAEHAALVVKIDNHPAARPAGRPQPGRHRVRGDRRGDHPLLHGVPLADPGPGGPDPLGPHPGPLPGRQPERPAVRLVRRQPQRDPRDPRRAADRHERPDRHRQPRRPVPPPGRLLGAAQPVRRRPRADDVQPAGRARARSRCSPTAGRATRSTACRPRASTSTCWRTNAEWRWDPASRTYLRTNSGRPHKDQSGQQVGTNNVVVLTIAYRPSPADARSPEAQTTGTGDAMIFTDGQVVLAKWSRADGLRPVDLHRRRRQARAAHPRPHVGRAGRARRRRHRQVAPGRVRPLRGPCGPSKRANAPAPRR